MIYTYDSTFDGLLTCIHEHYYHQKAEAIYQSSSWQMNVLYQHQHIKTDDIKAQKVYRALQEKLSTKTVQDIFYTFLADDDLKENHLLGFIHLAFKMRNKIDNMYTHPVVLPIRELVQKVSFEKHRFLGLLRFRDTGSFLYADYAPDHDITGLLAPFFADRLSNERFIIHDLKRSIAAVYQDKRWYLQDFKLDVELPETRDEKVFRTLWQHYFETAAIESRINPKLQRRCMPQRYWKYLTEMQRRDGLSFNDINTQEIKQNKVLLLK